MVAIVRYTRGAVVRSAYGRPMPPRMRMAITAGRYAYRNRKKIVRAGKTIYRAYKRYKQTKHARRAAPSARTTSTTMATPYVDTNEIKVLYRKTVRFPPQDNTNHLHTREHNVIELSGIKVCFQFILGGDASVMQDAMTAHFAIVQPKSPEWSNADLLADFLVDRQNTDKKTMDWADYHANDMRYNCNGINPKKFHILTHLKKNMVNAGYTGQTNQMVWYWKIDKYIRLKKTFAFKNLEDEEGVHPFLVLYWAEPLDPLTSTEQVGPLATYNTSGLITPYWRSFH